MYFYIAAVSMFELAAGEKILNLQTLANVICKM